MSKTEKTGEMVPVKDVIERGAPIRQWLSSAKMEHALSQVSRSLPAPLLVKTALGVFAKNPELADCTQESIYLALVQCAEAGLDPASHLDYVYLYKYGQELKADIGYKGLMHLCRQTGVTVRSQVIYADDGLDLDFEPPSVKHRPGDVAKRTDDNIVGAYAAAFAHGERVLSITLMSRPEIDAARAESKSKDAPAWRKWFPRMARKTAIKRLLKGGEVPLTPELGAAMAMDEYITAADREHSALRATLAERSAEEFGS